MKHLIKLTLCSLAAAALQMATTSCSDVADDPVNESVENGDTRSNFLLPNSHLSTYATYELAVGYSYDVRATYGQGVRYQIFDIVSLDRLQTLEEVNYVCDDYQGESQQEVIESETEQDLNTELSLSGSVGLEAFGSNVKVSGSYTQTDIESRKYSYGMLRIINTLFTRDLQYNNILVAASKADAEGYFTPAFRKDWAELQALNKESEGSPALNGMSQLVANFLDRWGAAFVSRSWMGGYLHYKVAIEKAFLTNGLTVGAVLEAEFKKIVKGDATVNYEAIRKQISGHYTQELSVAGGDVQLVSIINNENQIDNLRFTEWSNSITWGKGPLQDNTVLSNMTLVSIATLFDGRVRQELERQIAEIKYEE